MFHYTPRFIFNKCPIQFSFSCIPIIAGVLLSDDVLGPKVGMGRMEIRMLRKALAKLDAQEVLVFQLIRTRRLWR
jgi:hypothetical protein